MKVLNMGAGVQTTAILLEFPKSFDAVIFADTGAEQAETYYYIDKYLKPFCAENDIPWHTVKPKVTLEQHCLDKKIIPIPTRRWCTADFKVKPIKKKLRELGATAKNPITSIIGISIDEAHRANFHTDVKYQLMEYPLVDKKITRKDCYDIIEKHGFPIPAKSGCDFCMFFSRNHFRELSKKNPKRFAEIVAMEKNSYSYGKYYLKGQYPLDSISGNSSLEEFNEYEDSCDSGHCMN
jgi:hypothetical protein